MRIHSFLWGIFFLLFSFSACLPKADKEDNNTLENKIHIRINQVGYLNNDLKIAHVFCQQNLENIGFNVVRVGDGVKVFGPVNPGSSLGAYAGYNHHYHLDFSDFTTPGRYKIMVEKELAVSTEFVIDDSVYVNKADFILSFMQAQRCGDNSFVKAKCHLVSGTSRLDGQAADGPDKGSVMDVSGGWHDAGDYIKFMLTVADTTFFMLFAYQENPHAFGDIYLNDLKTGNNGVADVLDEAKYGLDWIMRMHPQVDRFYLQVGDGKDHSAWRLPNLDQAPYPTAPFRPVYYGTFASHTGRASAALALASLIWRKLGEKSYADKCLKHAREIYELAKKNMKAFGGVAPDFFYEDKAFYDHMELAAAELYKATKEEQYLSDAKTWAPLTQNLHEWYKSLSFIAHYELYPLVDGDTRNRLKQLMEKDLDQSLANASREPFGWSSGEYSWGALVMVTENSLHAYLYQKLQQSPKYQKVAVMGRDYLLGKNQWGVCFIVGLGTVYPKNPHHQIARILDIDIMGMPIEGPVSRKNWESYGATKGGTDPYAEFQSNEAVYYDDVQDYSTNEPTIFQAAVTMALFSFLSR